MAVSNTPDGGNLTPEQIAARDAVIEADYRAGLKPLRQIGKEHGLSHTAIAKMAKERSWERDLSARIRAKADAKVAKAAVSKEVSEKRLATEQAVVEASAQLQFNVRMDHRTAIKRGRLMWDRLVGELEASLTDPEAIDRVLKAAGDAFTAQERGELKKQLLRAGSVGQRIGSAKSLVDMLEKLVRMERVAFGIEDGAPEDDLGSAAGAAAAAAAGNGRALTDAERAIRLHRLLNATPGQEAS